MLQQSDVEDDFVASPHHQHDVVERGNPVVAAQIHLSNMTASRFTLIFSKACQTLNFFKAENAFLDFES